MDLGDLWSGSNTFVPFGRFRRFFHQPDECYRTQMGLARGLGTYDYLRAPQFDLQDVHNDSFSRTYFDLPKKYKYDQSRGIGAANTFYFPAQRKATHPQDTTRSSRKDRLGQHSSLVEVYNKSPTKGLDWMGRVQRQVGVLERAEWEGMRHFARLRGVYHYRDVSFFEFEDLANYDTLHGRLFSRSAPVSENDAHLWTEQLIETQVELKKLGVYLNSWDLKDFLVDGRGTVKLADMRGGMNLFKHNDDGSVRSFLDLVGDDNTTLPEMKRGDDTIDPDKAAVYMIGRTLRKTLSHPGHARLLTNEVANFIQTATATDPQARSTLNELLCHSWMIFPPPPGPVVTLEPLRRPPHKAHH
ncbi:unnamed protein product [Vitrella brassicaformis CCMP3155]|uniref:Protein kinase domain-containing protein n=2 Tax=Vitrella brassicaformis TaxID=1169539 RepID=A0A0G4EBI0_VITBC|nr:unnamed protein product [Vitrella brassicaformis CCMP3155]|eukprot:CEL92632.1 unnamed protein product [Vitrella brassicaformis CCMP3155]